MVEGHIDISTDDFGPKSFLTDKSLLPPACRSPFALSTFLVVVGLSAISQQQQQQMKGRNDWHNCIVDG